jgi:transglutaminase-like putative cysteine protease
VPRAVALALLPLLALAVAWLRLESPAEIGDGFAIAVLALAPALAGGPRRRALAAAAAALGAVWVAVGASPAALLPGTDAEWLDPLLVTVGDGVADFYEVGLPFAPAERPQMHAVALLALFAFGVALGLAAAARRPVLAVAVVVLGAGWPATLVDERAPLAVGALVLASALWLLLLSRPDARRGVVPGVVVSAAVVALAATASTSSALSREPVVDWQQWDLYDPPASQIGVRYVWDANYGGIEFPDEETVVLRVEAPRRAQYWRASTLDTFIADRWIENLYPVALGEPGRVPRDGLLPPAATRRADWVEQRVEVAALRDDHLVAAGTAMEIESSEVDRVFYLTGGVVRAPRGLREGDEYVVRSHVPRPSPRDLVESRPDYPPALGRFLELGRVRLPAFGTPGRDAAVDGLLADDRNVALAAYAGVWQTARRLAGEVGSPYEVTLGLERWLRSRGGFRYEEQPPRSRTLPPLADFVTRTRAGYCQHFAGAMALMLRFLGIPARVAVGFTSGDWKDGAWVVTDHDAHAWVEAWFDGHGWLAFDPTPGRGTLSATYTIASDSADAIAALREGRFDLPVDGGAGTVTAPLATPAAAEGRNAWPFLGVLLAGAAAALAIGTAKLARRRARYLTRDPRRLAAATRAELVDYLRDQGLPVHPRATLAELGTVLERRAGVSARAYVAAAGRARYGAPAGAAAAAREARREARTILRVLRERLTPRRRLRGWFALRSLRGA